MPVLLVVEDRADIRMSLSLLFSRHDYEVIEVDNVQKGQETLQDYAVDLVLLDMNLQQDTTSGEEGLNFLRWMQTQSLKIPVIGMTAWANTQLIVDAMHLGARDFFEKPWKNKQLLNIVKQQLTLSKLDRQNHKLKQHLLSNDNSEQYQWQSPCMLQLMQQLSTIAKTDASILLTGENGCGKSELAAFLHHSSHQATQPLVSVNMGAISENLFESEMFGHKKGAFTDAKNDRMGRFELAEDSTLFLDEIANIPLSQQAKLLRVLESGEFESLGSSKTHKTNTRIVSATNANLKDLINNGEFRQDLYFRLNTIELRVPSLRERKQDIIPLALYFARQLAIKYNKSEPVITSKMQQKLVNYSWPGNIRELKHAVERAVILSHDETLNFLLSDFSDGESTELPMMTLREAEVRLIQQALVETEGHIPKAAKLLGLTKASMYRRIEKYDLVV